MSNLQEFTTEQINSIQGIHHLARYEYVAEEKLKIGDTVIIANKLVSVGLKANKHKKGYINIQGVGSVYRVLFPKWYQGKLQYFSRGL